MKKYCLLSGFVFGKYDSDKHYISAKKLCELYNLNPRECYLMNNEFDFNGKGLEDNMIILRPRHNGDYKDYLKKAMSNELQKEIEC